MENNLLININNVLTIDSREVAEMIGKEHDQLMRSIRNYIKYIHSAKMQSEKFFKESTYLNSRNQVQPCYELTKMGCEMVANKMTGEKGIVFTAKYVERFNTMENFIKNQERAFLTEQIKILETLANEFKTLSLEARQYFKPLHKTKLELNRLIKSLTSNNQEANLVKRWVFMKMGIRTWEDTCLDDIPKIKELIHSTSQLVQIDNFEQISLLQ